VADARQALTLAGGAGYRILEGQAHTILAAAHLDLGDYAQAIEHARRALALHRRTGHRLGYARALVTLGHVLRRAGDVGAATAAWRRALALLDDLGSPEADQVRSYLLDGPA
jgi:tetratricopeptide (TPR) repeat protein